MVMVVVIAMEVVRLARVIMIVTVTTMIVSQELCSGRPTPIQRPIEHAHVGMFETGGSPYVIVVVACIGQWKEGSAWSV